MYSYQEYANGGVRSHVPTGIYPGGANILKFAEPETRWEAFVSGKRGEEERNRGILAEAAKRLGMGVYRLQQYADGGIVRHARAAEASGRVYVSRPGRAESAQLVISGPLVSVESMTVDSQDRAEQMARELWDRAARSSRAQGRVLLGGAVK